MMILRYGFWLCFLCCLLTREVNAVTLLSIQLKAHSDHIQFIFSDKVKAHVFSLSHPERLVLDVPEGHLGVNLSKLNTHLPKKSPVNVFREGYPAPHTLRIVMDLSQSFHFTVSSDNRGHHLILTLEKAPHKFPVALIQSVKKASIQSSLHPITIVIDPGHGGKDAGAIGPHGGREKDVVLAIAKILASLINHETTMRAILTRDGDYFVTLHNRLVFARKGRADIFIAIHADSYFNSSATGATVYALSRHGSTSIAARWLANRDNYSELGGVNLEGLADQSYVLRSVLIDLAQTATTSDSLRLGSTLLDSLDQVAKRHDTRVEQAPFMVLKSPDIPSILVETGFISNPREEMRLRDPQYQHRIALALYKGLQDYVKKYSALGV